MVASSNTSVSSYYRKPAQWFMKSMVGPAISSKKHYKRGSQMVMSMKPNDEMEEELDDNLLNEEK